MKKLTPNDPETRSADVLASNIEQLKALFPEAATEGGIDFDVLKQLLGGAAEEREEKYGLNWYGKRRARQIALAPSTGTLRPCLEDSVAWDTTQNIMIEGDNLEVLKLLQKSYSGKVKLIYIDPPYNTGNEFIYPDRYEDNLATYLRYTGQVSDEGFKVSTNTDASGRFHTNWLNMMYPRLKLARNLLREDGLIFISIDDNEQNHLIDICNEVFGHECFVGMVTRNTGTSTGGGSQILVSMIDYIVIYSRSAEASLRGLTHSEAEAKIYDQEDERGKYLSRSLRRTGGEHFREDRPSMYYPIKGPDGVDVYPIGPGGYESRWVCGPKTYEEHVRNGLIEWKQVEHEGRVVWRPYQKTYLEGRTKQPSNLWTDVAGNKKATRDMTAMLGEKVFDSPKPVELLHRCIGMACDEDSIVLDFFAGSGTTGHAVMAQNASDGGNRRYILIQLPEQLDPANKEQKIGSSFCDTLKAPRHLAEITKERLRRAARMIRAENPMSAGDLGFRVFKLDSSNIRAWEPEREALPKSLFESVDHLKTDRTETDILYELLLKLGLDLCVPIEKKKISGKDVHSIGGGVLLACLADKIARDQVEPLAAGIVNWHKALAPAGDTTCVFRDSAFADDVAKTNLAAILNQHGLANVRSL